MHMLRGTRGLILLLLLVDCAPERGVLRSKGDSITAEPMVGRSATGALHDGHLADAGGSADDMARPGDGAGAQSAARETLTGATGVAAGEEPDGNDDPSPDDQGPPLDGGHFVRVGKPQLSLKRICDLKVFRDSLYAAHANEPLGTDGATISRYRPDDSPPFSVAFDWNRPGEPTEGGGAGQGFLRIRAIDGQLFVPDADPPHNGFGLSEPGTEGFVFISDVEGNFGRARPPHHRPPAAPNGDGGAGAGILPRAYHVLDVIRFRDRLYASTGSVPPKERAWRGPSPGALHVASPDRSRWTYEVDYPYPWQNGVWRLTFLVRFRGRLYAGIQDYDGREPNDFVVFNPPKNSDRIERADARAVRVTRTGGAQTLRWFVDHGTLYWLAWTRESGIRLAASEDGEMWRMVQLPEQLGYPTDIVRYRGALHILMEWGLVRLGPASTVPTASTVSKASGATPGSKASGATPGSKASGAAPGSKASGATPGSKASGATPGSKESGATPGSKATGELADGGTTWEGATIVARVEEKKTPFAFDDVFCASPLAVFRGELYAGGQRGGLLYKIVSE